MSYITLTNENFNSVTSEGVSLVDFWAPWCGPCRALAPTIDKLASDFSGSANICKVNTDEQQELSSQFSIRSIPTILIIKDGKIVDTLNGAQSIETLSSSINDALAN
jgi:thioredoxin 1